MHRVAVLLMGCAVLTLLAPATASARRMTDFEKEVLRGQRYNRAQEKASAQEEEQEAATRAAERKRRAARQKNLRAQQRRAVYDIELDGDDLGDESDAWE